MFNPTTSYALGDYIANLRFGMIRNMRFVKINKTPIALRLTELLCNQGALRSFRVESDHIAIYYRYNRGRHIITKLQLISKPSKRVYWDLKTLIRNYNVYNFSGFYIISTPKGIYTSDYCLLQGHTGGTVLFRVEF